MLLKRKHIIKKIDVARKVMNAGKMEEKMEYHGSKGNSRHERAQKREHLTFLELKESQGNKGKQQEMAREMAVRWTV